MINIIEKFFELYKNNQIEVNWDKSDLSFNLENGSATMLEIVQELNNSETNNDIEEKDVVNSFFIILTNRIGEYYNDKMLDEEEHEDLTKYIEENVDRNILDDINNNIFLDNSIINDRLKDIKYEIMTKRDTENIININGYTTRITLKTVDKEEEKLFDVELTKEELEETINILTKAKEDMNKLINREG